jgi:hypothetical protein
MAMVGAQQRARGTVGMGRSEREADMDGERCRCREFPAAPAWLRKRLCCCHGLPVLYIEAC